MAKINQNVPRGPAWPWGGPSTVREKLVNRTQLEKKNARKKGDPKNPALASSALIDSISPAHSADELRLPMPPAPPGHDADVESYTDRPQLSTVAERAHDDQRAMLESGLQAIRAPADRIERLKSLLARENQMLQLVGNLSNDMEEIQRRMREEQREESF
jgi:hypothetical protein